MSSTGYAVIQWDGQYGTVIELGHIDNKKQGRVKWSHGKRLVRIFNSLEFILQEHPDIDVIVREKGITRFNKATQVIFRVVGVVDYLTEKQAKMSCIEIGISEAKRLITGNGKAEKAEVAEKVQGYLTESVEFAVDDESDAVAIGIAYCLKEEI